MPEPMIPGQVANKRPALPVKIIQKAENLTGSLSLWEKAKKYLAEKVLQQIVKNAGKIMDLVNKYEDYLLNYISNPNIRILIDGATDILGKLVKEWTKEYE